MISPILSFPGKKFFDQENAYQKKADLENAEQDLIAQADPDVPAGDLAERSR